MHKANFGGQIGAGNSGAITRNAIREIAAVGSFVAIKGGDLWTSR